MSHLRMLRLAFFVAALVSGAAQVVGASALPASHQVVLSVSAAGDGAVVSRDQRIRCGSRCSAGYPSGSLVTLYARPVRDAEFLRWKGDCVGTATVCSVALDRQTAVKAVF